MLPRGRMLSVSAACLDRCRLGHRGIQRVPRVWLVFETLGTRAS
uniref:Ubiquitin specific peptidase 2 n=1 Tax=Mus musculus TaxID=10090 RepID=H3BLH3_MOUSE